MILPCVNGIKCFWKNSGKAFKLQLDNALPAENECRNARFLGMQKSPRPALPEVWILTGDLVVQRMVMSSVLKPLGRCQTADCRLFLRLTSGKPSPRLHLTDPMLEDLRTELQKTFSNSPLSKPCCLPGCEISRCSFKCKKKCFERAPLSRSVCPP